MAELETSPSDDSPAAGTIPAGAYTADIPRSELRFRAKAFGLRWVHGRMPAVSGTFSVADGRLSGSGQVSAERISTGIAARDWHLRSSHYLHTARYPVVALSIESADITARVAECTVVVRDTAATVPVEITSFDVVDSLLHLEARFELDRTPYPMLSPVAGVSRIVQVELRVVARPAG